MNKRPYVWYRLKHWPKSRDYKMVTCGQGLYMRWDCVSFFIEEELGLHKNKKQNCYIIGSIKNVTDFLEEDEMIAGGSCIDIQIKPWWTLFDINDPKKKNYGDVFYPAPIKASWCAAGASSLLT